jgi:hypothetical protein
MFDIVDPTIQPVRESIPYAARPQELRGLRVGLIENTKKNSEAVLQRLAQKLEALHGIKTEVLLHKAQRAPLKDAELDALRGRVDFVISGIGD